MKLRIISKQRGIGLLELMLALAIIAVLLIMATRYYSAANVNQQISTAVDMFSATKAAVQNYAVDNPGKSLSGLTISSLASSGYLPNSYSKSVGPWGGTFTLSPGTGNFTVKMTSVPSAAETGLKSRLDQTMNSGLGETSSVSGGSAQATYSY